jgi:hypothetical protein
MHASPKKKYPNKVPPIIDVMDRFLSVCGPRTLVGGRGLGDIPKRPSLSFSLPSNEMRRLVTFTFAMLFPVLAHATQETPTSVEYTNDTIEQGGKLAACIVTTAIISPPTPELVNFQVLVAGEPTHSRLPLVMWIGPRGRVWQKESQQPISQQRNSIIHVHSKKASHRKDS